jgi:hypothetical protein
MTGDHPRNTGSMLVSPPFGAKTRFGQALHVAGGRQEALSNAWRRAGIGRAERESERVKARLEYERSD